MLRGIRQLGFLFLFLPLVFVQCIETDSGAEALTTSGEESPAGVIEVEVGTNVGNPTTPTKNSVTFITSTEVQDIEDFVADVPVDETEASNGGPPINEIFPMTSSNCKPIIEPDKGFVSQQCNVTPDEVHLGMAALWLTDCSNDGPTFCHNKLATSVTQRVELYNGPPIDMLISSAGMEFSGINNIDEKILARGAQAVTTYIGLKLPDSDEIISYLRGKSVRICTSPDEYLDDETMEAYCGTPGIKFGQMTFDIDGDGFYGYINMDTLTPDFAEETETPLPDDKYAQFSTSFLRVIKNDTASVGYYPFTDTSFYDVAGFYAPLIPTFSPQEISSDTSHKFTLSFDITGVTKFMDGMMSHVLGQNTCVEGVVPGKTLCNGVTNSDEGSFGWYNPFYDAGLYNESPKVEFLIE